VRRDLAIKILKPFKTIGKFLTEKPMTFPFPPISPVLTERNRGRHIYYPEKCVSCRLCGYVCPNKAIEFELQGKDKETGRLIVKTQVDFAKCCFCGLCEDICPSGALELTPFPFLVAMDKKELCYDWRKLSEKPSLTLPSLKEKKGIIQWARSRSFWVINFFTGCCFIEAVPWVASSFDMERFGLIATASPRHSDVLLVGGYVTTKTLKRIIRIYSQMPRPKFVIVLGNCPMTGGTYWDSYNTIKQLDKYIPVDLWIAGCPPRAENIGYAVVLAMWAVQHGYTGKEEYINTEGGKYAVPRAPVRISNSEYVVEFGPQHPASGNFNLTLKLEGEVVKEAKPNVGYLHRGFEKLMEYRTWYQNIMIVQRVCVLDGAPYELGYAGAVEKIAGIEVPDRAKYLRVVQAELSRIQSHLLNIGLTAASAGFDTVTRMTWGDRDRILFLLEYLTRGRIYNIYSVPGGVRYDIPIDFKAKAMDVIRYMRNKLKVYDDLLFNNETFIVRTENIGVLPKEEAIKLDVTGPNLRGSSVDFDVRAKIPYEAYGDLDFKVAIEDKGDAYSRMLCRRKEIEESLHIIEQAIDKLPGGPIAQRKAKDGSSLISFLGKIPEGEAIHCVESARGELCFHIVSTGGISPYRVKIRGPTFDTILVALPKVLKGAKLADVPVIYWSFDNCPADHDR